MALDVFMVYVTIFSLFFLLEVMAQWLNIWVKFMLFFMTLISYYLQPLLLPKN